MVRLDEVEPHRQIMFDAFEMSGGYLINHKKLRAQTMHFLKEIGACFTWGCANNAVYRLRLMMGHLRNFKVDQKQLPTKYMNLHCI